MSVLDAAHWQDQMTEVNARFEDEHPFGSALITMAGVEPLELNVLVAASASQRARGMTGRIFDGFDAMLFSFPVPTTAGFHMGGVTVPLLVAFYGRDGTAVGFEELTVNGPAVQPSDPYSFALEVPAVSVAADLMRNGVAIVVQAESFKAQLRKAGNEEVGLQPASAPEVDCANCCFFMPTAACELVMGPVAPTMVCDLFADMGDPGSTAPTELTTTM